MNNGNGATSISNLPSSLKPPTEILVITLLGVFAHCLVEQVVLPAMIRLHGATKQASPALAAWISGKALNLVPEKEQQKQVTWCELVYKSVVSDLLSVSSERDCIRLRSLSAEDSCLWLMSIPSSVLGLTLSSFEFGLC